MEIPPLPKTMFLYFFKASVFFEQTLWWELLLLFPSTTWTPLLRVLKQFWCSYLLQGPSDVFLFLVRTCEFSKLQSMNLPKMRNECTNFQTLITTLSVLKRYDWVKHEEPSLLECYTLTGAVTMLLRSVLPRSSRPRSPRKAAYGTRDKVPLDSILATLYTVCKWWFLNTWCSWSSTHRWSSDRKAWVSYSLQRIIFLAFQTPKMEEAH